MTLSRQLFQLLLQFFANGDVEIMLSTSKITSDNEEFMRVLYFFSHFRFKMAVGLLAVWCHFQ